MTDGHTHRTVKVARDGLIHRALTRPLIYVDERVDARARARVEDSPYPYGPADAALFARNPAAPQRFYLSALSILHRWTGLVIEIPDDEDPVE